MPTLSSSTRRSLRTLFQSVLAMITAVPGFLALLPSGTPLAVKAATIVAALAVVSKVVNLLEDDGLIPAWLKGSAVVATTVAAPVADPAVTEPVVTAPLADPVGGGSVG